MLDIHDRYFINGIALFTAGIILLGLNEILIGLIVVINGLLFQYVAQSIRRKALKAQIQAKRKRR